jgi:hypothetical protein
VDTHQDLGTVSWSSGPSRFTSSAPPQLSHMLLRMPSVAQVEWFTTREARIGELYAAHLAVGGGSRGRRYATEQLNWSIALRLAGEFQGYARDLHDEAVDVTVSRTYSSTPAFEANLRNLLTRSRDLDQKNATPSSLQTDFSRLGFLILQEIRANYTYGGTWLGRLEQLNTARNGVAHGDRSKMRQAAGGEVLALAKVRQWHAAIRGLVRASDRVTSTSLARVNGGMQPW